jgi:hypothetical protein
LGQRDHRRDGRDGEDDRDGNGGSNATVNGSSTATSAGDRDGLSVQRRAPWEASHEGRQASRAPEKASRRTTSFNIHHEWRDRLDEAVRRRSRPRLSPAVAIRAECVLAHTSAE